MPFCPNCKSEYRPGFAKCSDCESELVESLSEENNEQGNRGELNLIMLASFPDPMQAQMFRELLDLNGIESILQSDFNAGAGRFTASPNAVLVQEGDLLKGRELYEEYVGGDDAASHSVSPENRNEDS